MSSSAQDLSPYPGGDMVAKGLDDLKNGVCSEDALLVLVASPRLIALGFEIPTLDTRGSPEHALYAEIVSRRPIGAHAAYNALIQKVVSFANSYALALRQAEKSAANVY